MVHKCCVTNFNGNSNIENKVQRSEVIAPRCSVKKVFLEISQNSQENTCAKVCRLRPATLLKTRLWHRCFPVNFTKFLRTFLSTEHLRWLLLKGSDFTKSRRKEQVDNHNSYRQHFGL